MANAAVAAGLRRDHVRHYAASDEAAEALAALLHRGDLILVKGSRGVRTDRIVDRLKEQAR
jgi:UDP-N-acetylmuramoyl-tripeptide--D-alanyl-D-alanine ligase